MFDAGFSFASFALITHAFLRAFLGIIPSAKNFCVELFLPMTCHALGKLPNVFQTCNMQPFRLSKWQLHFQHE